MRVNGRAGPVDAPFSCTVHDSSRSARLNGNNGARPTRVSARETPLATASPLLRRHHMDQARALRLPPWRDIHGRIMRTLAITSCQDYRARFLLAAALLSAAAPAPAGAAVPLPLKDGGIGTFAI